MFSREGEGVLWRWKRLRRKIKLY